MHRSKPRNKEGEMNSERWMHAVDVPLQRTESEERGPRQESVSGPVLTALLGSHLRSGEAELSGKRVSQDSPGAASCALGEKNIRNGA